MLLGNPLRAKPTEPVPSLGKVIEPMRLEALEQAVVSSASLADVHKVVLSVKGIDAPLLSEIHRNGASALARRSKKRALISCALAAPVHPVRAPVDTVASNHVRTAGSRRLTWLSSAAITAASVYMLPPLSRNGYMWLP